jgi:hypothetical protein
MLSRRELVGKLAAGAAGAAVAWAATGGRANAASDSQQANGPIGFGNGDAQIGPAPEAPVSEAHAAKLAEAHGAWPLDKHSPPAVAASAPVAEPPPWELLHPLAVGSVVAHGWRVAELTGVDDGSCVLTLRNERGRAHRVHVCRNDGHPQGLVYTDRLDLVVMNGGQGDLPTEEGLAQAVAEVAHVLAANEGNLQQAPLVVALLPHAERLNLFGDSVGTKLR